MDTMDTIILGTAEAMGKMRSDHYREVERLKERLGAVTMLLGCAKTALKGGRAIDAAEWITQAEQAATRGGDK